MINTENKARFVFYICLSLFLTYALFRFFHVEGVYYLFPLSMAGLIFLTDRAFSIDRPRLAKYSFCPALLLALTFVVGRNADTQNLRFESFDAKDIIYLLALVTMFFIVFYVLTDFVLRRTVATEEVKTGKGDWLIFFAVIALAWQPYYLAYYPGCFSFDSFFSVEQALGNVTLSNWQPVLYSLYLRIFIALGRFCGGDINTGLGLACLFQMLFLASACAALVCHIKKRGCRKWIYIAALLFFAVNPVIALYSVTFWKDVFFAGWLVFLVLLLFEIKKSDGHFFYSPCKTVLFSLVCLFTVFARNNGIYIIGVLFIALLVCCKKQLKITVPVFAVILAVVFLIKGPLFDYLGVAPTMIEESLAIPLQQIGYTLSVRGIINLPQLQFLANILPTDIYRDIYCPTSIDPIKMHEIFNSQFLQDNLWEFLKVWFKIFLKNPGAYFKAYCMQTKGYWCIDTIDWANIIGVYKNDFGVYNKDIIMSLTGLDIKQTIYKLAETLRHSPLVGDLFNIALSFVICAYSCLLASLRRMKNWALPWLPLILLWLTIMIATPVYCEFRYMFAFHILLPLMLIEIFSYSTGEPRLKERKKI